jgi:hypothetical protein
MTQSKFCFHVRCKIHYIFKFQTILRMEWCQVGPYCLFLHSSTFAKQSCMDAISSRGSRWRQKQDVRIPIGYGKSSAWMYHLTQTLIFLTWALTEIILVFLLKRQKKIQEQLYITVALGTLQRNLLLPPFINIWHLLGQTN